VRARIDISACRQYREKYYKNPVTQMRTELYAPFYHKRTYPPDTFFEGGPLAKTLDARQQAFFHEAVANLELCHDYHRETDI
jgi:hypothetical protein